MNLALITALATAPSTGAAMAALTGDSLQIANAAANSQVAMLQCWTTAQAVGTTNIVYPSGHDVVRGIRYRNVAGDGSPKLALGAPPRLRAQDPLTLTQVGSATAGDIEHWSALFFYEDLPGIDAHLINLATLRSRAKSLLTIEATLAALASGQYGTEEALNAESDLLKANTEYAVLGLSCGVDAHCVSLRGPDTGNMRIGMPGETALSASYGPSWFVHLAEWYDVPAIPVINSANKAATFLSVVTNEDGTTVPISLHLAQLT